ncbi:filamentous hemagglutinin N-terminal domain-containing protein [Brasilonema sp. UFV-L1]|uniref:two-partner secretion domain-containing protein n=1 Tax=Brasilonema sp. UFV-L1 TaxID=2234130 RepID=UPI00145C9422|nr:filamentous hemagglutinin N-terminal domain-containing protein [Brasilonema sp. UFV-L1]NMG09244.1 filamentous hemagglutinin [Brasilonema sp. UFV-L1]
MKKISLILLTLPLYTMGSFTFIGTLRAQQVTSDGTVSTTVTTPDGKNFNINDGTRRGGNLFHSFKDFSVPKGGSANFNNPTDVQNIISRVTGGSVSSINGLIRALGKANLFLINPAGIIFGQNASLNIGGSFLGSTANSFVFDNGFEFSATDPQAPPLLTINIPIGLRFRDNPGEIVNQSRASFEGARNTINSPAGLQVPNGKTLALVGGNVSLSGGNLTALSGRIELGSVDGDSFVSLNEIDTGYALGYQNVQKFRDIQLSRVTQGGALVDTSGDGGGDIQVQGKNITLTGNSLIFSYALGSQPRGNLTINAAESVKLSGVSQILTVAQGQGKAGDVLVKASDSVELEGASQTASRSTLIGSQVSSSCVSSPCGNGGDVKIETGRLIVRDGANIDTSTFGLGNAGNILIKGSNSVDVTGTNNNPNNKISSGIRAQVADQQRINNPGNAGNVTIETQRLTVQGGAQISSAGRKTGNSGNLNINATDSILLSGASPFATGEPFDTGRSGLFVSAEPGATGNVGSLNLTTGLLTVENGARISADNFGSGLPNSSTLNVRQLVIQNGGEVKSGSFAAGDGGTLTVNATKSVDVVGSGTIAGNTITSTLFSEASADSSGKAGNLIINTPNLNVRDGAEVTVRGKGSGSAGNLTVTANTIRLNQGKLIAETNAGEGGNIKLQDLKLLQMQNQSRISAEALKDANGGNITINATNGFVVVFPGQNNDIVANAIQGIGGNININATRIYGLEQRSSNPPNTTNDIDASSQFNFSGNVIINTQDFDPSRELFVLPQNVIDPNEQIAQNPCLRGGGEFLITGRGGFPSSPNQVISSDNVRVDLVKPVVNTKNSSGETKNSSNETKNQSSTTATDKPIVPARGWIFNDKGEVVLVAYDPTKTDSPRSWKSHAGCSVF